MGSVHCRIAVAVGLVSGTLFSASLHSPAAAVHAATHSSPLLPAAAGQAAAPPNAKSQAGLPPNLDWSIFFPAGEGQFQAAVYCNSCHSAQVVVTRQSDADGWGQIVRRMIDMRSAPIQPEDATIITKYLGDVLSPTAPPLALPIPINAASNDQLRFLGLLPPEALQKILDARAKGKIKDFATLQAIAGDKSVDKYKGVLSFE